MAIALNTTVTYIDVLVEVPGIIEPVLAQHAREWRQRSCGAPVESAQPFSSVHWFRQGADALVQLDWARGFCKAALSLEMVCTKLLPS